LPFSLRESVITSRQGEHTNRLLRFPSRLIRVFASTECGRVPFTLQVPHHSLGHLSAILTITSSITALSTGSCYLSTRSSQTDDDYPGYANLPLGSIIDIIACLVFLQIWDSRPLCRTHLRSHNSEVSRTSTSHQTDTHIIGKVWHADSGAPQDQRTPR
jgi:hypothetical protein